MTQEEFEHIKPLLSNILENAIRNKVYYQNAVIACGQLDSTLLKFKEVEKIKTCLAELIRLNYKTREAAENVRANLRLRNNYRLEKNVQELMDCLLKSENGRKTLFQNKNFINYIEPLMHKRYRKDMKKINNQEIADIVWEIANPKAKQSSEDLSAD